MMTKEEHIVYWKSSAEENWETAVFLKTGHQNLFSLFAFHLVVEKLLKAHWVKDNIPNSPPRIHDLPELFKQTELELTFDQVDYLNTINGWNIEGRYPDYKRKVNQLATDFYLDFHFHKLAELKKCLLERL